MAGETALARQLKKLAAPQTSLLQQNRIRKSLLFDHRYAATLDRDVIFAHGICGLEKLEEINTEFSQFRKNLYSNNYAEIERSVQSSSFNKALDANIRTFLCMLSPYFINSASAQALEWLVYRYHIHLYNTDELIACAIPHFNTTYFVRVIQLLNLDDEKSRWAWLKPLLKSGEPLVYPVILNRFVSDGGFRTFICKLAPNIVEVYKSNMTAAGCIVAFSMQTMCDALDKNGFISDSVIVSYLPFLLKGLKSELNRYTAASYLILSKILVKVTLTDELVTTLLIKIFENVNDDLLGCALELLLITFQEQPIKCVNNRLLHSILSKHNYMQHLMYLSSFNADCLLSALIRKAIFLLFKRKPMDINPKKNKLLLRFCNSVLSDIKLSKKLATQFLNVILSNFMKFSKNKKIKFIKFKFVGELLQKLEVKYPDCFDKVISKYLNCGLNKSNTKLRKLINSSICSVKNSVLPDCSTTLILGINHSSEEIRKTSINIFLEKAEEIQDKEFVKSVILSKFYDDSAKVVEEMLKCPDIILQFIDKKDILSGLGYLLLKNVSTKSNWYAVQMKAIDILCEYFTENELALEVFVTLLPFIFPLKKSAVAGYSKVLNSKHGTALIKDQREGLNYSTIYVVNQYISSLSTAELSLFLEFLHKKCVETSSNSLYVIYILSAGHAIISKKNACEVIVWLDQLLNFCVKLLNHPNMCFDNFVENASDEDILQNITLSLSKEKFPVSVIYTIIFNIVKYIKLDFNMEACVSIQLNNSSQQESFKILMHLYKFCIKHMNSNRLMLSRAFQLITSQFICSQFQNLKHLILFLSIFWASVTEKFCISLQVSSFCVAKTFCHPSNDFSWFFDSHTLCLGLIKAVSSQNQEVRRHAVSFLTSLLDCAESSKSPLKYLCLEIQKHSEEILIDYNQCYSAISVWLSVAVISSNEKKNNTHMLDDLNFRHSTFEIFLNILKDELIPLSMKYEILVYFQQLDSANLLSIYVTIIKNYLKNLEESDLDKNLLLDIIQMLLNKYTTNTAASLKESSAETDVLIECMTFKQEFDNPKNVQIFALNVLSKDFFIAIPSIVVQKKVLETLLDLYATSSPQVNEIVKKKLEKLSIYAFIVVKDFSENICGSSKVATLKDVKKSRIGSKQEVSDSFDGASWKRLSLLLEIVKDKSKLEKIQLLIPDLFSIFNQTLNANNQSSVEYLWQLLLSAIHNCCQQLDSEGIDETKFRVELIVKCIRSSRNPKTHQLSLLLLTLAAKLFPDLVLNHSMSIFTFMGSNIIRQDDSYSFQLISQTIETIVPAFLEASIHKKNDTVQVVAEVLRVFVDSLTDIPRHRQLPLFTKLISTLNPSKFLWIPLGQICDQYSSLFNDMRPENINNWKVSPTLEFAINLHKQFSPDVQIDTCINLLSFLTQLPDKKVTGDSFLKEPFNVASHSEQQLKVFKCNVLSYINMLLSFHDFISQVSELDSSAQSNLEKKYVLLLEKGLNYLQHQKSLPIVKSDEPGHSLIPLLINLICYVNSLLPTNLFIKVLRTLLKNQEPAIQNKAVEILNEKLEQQLSMSSKENHVYLLKLLKPLLKLVKNYDVSETKDKNSCICLQSVLYTLHLLTKIIGSSYPSKFYKVLNVTVHILVNSKNHELTINSLLCLAQLCSALNVEVLPKFNIFMPAIMNLLEDENILEMNDCLILGVIVALQSLIEHLGAFLGNYMQQLVTSICILSSKCQNTGKKTILEKLLALQSFLAKNVPLRILLSALEDSYSFLQITYPDSIIPFTQILNEKLSNCDYEDIKASIVPLETLSLLLLNFRMKTANLDFSSLCAIESNIIAVLKTFVMKLSVNIFESFFIKIFGWVSNNSEDDDVSGKAFTFYHLTSELSDCLKNLFVIVAKNFLRHSATTLDSNNLSKNELNENVDISSQLVIYILDTLKNCFVYSDGHLLDKEHFEMLMLPLINQIENYNSSRPELYQEMNKHLSKCVAHFISGVTDNNLWKKSNYQILLKTRHDTAAVRFAAIQVIREVVRVMGDSYLVLLPESIPFLAEIMEDESSEVEQECQSAILEMEKILGEPIRKYF